MSTIDLIEVTASKDGATIKFPFLLKDDFRCSFPSAKWLPSVKRWQVGPRSIKRLDTWVATVQKSGILEEIEDRDVGELTEKEISDVEYSLEIARRKLVELRTTATKMTANTKKLHAVRQALYEIHDNISVAEAEKAKAAQEELEARADVLAVVGKVVNVNEIEHLLAIMRKNMNIPKGYARESYEAASAELLENYEALKDAGIGSNALKAALEANKNRPDRDYKHLCLDLDFFVL